MLPLLCAVSQEQACLTKPALALSFVTLLPFSFIVVNIVQPRLLPIILFPQKHHIRYLLFCLVPDSPVLYDRDGTFSFLSRL